MAVQILSTTAPLNRKRQPSNQSLQTTTPTAKFEMLPPELLERIFTYVTLPIERATTGVQMPRAYTFLSILTATSNSDTEAPNKINPIQHLSLYPSLFVSHTFLAASLPVLYRNPKLDSPQAFELLLSQISNRPELGAFIRRLDLTKLVITLDDNWIRGIGPKALSSLLQRTTLLQEIKIGSQYGGARLHSSIWDCIFSQLPHLRNVEINDSDSRNQLQDFHLTPKTGETGWIEHLTITKSFALPQTTIRNILSSQPRLRSIDFSGSLIVGDWFNALSPSTRLRSLNLNDCLVGIDEDGRNPIVDFLSSHPAISSLEHLNLSSTADMPSLGLTTKDLSLILSHLSSSTLRSLDLRGTSLTRSQLPLLQHLTNLDELHISHDFHISDLETLVLGGEYTFPPQQTNLSPAQELLQVDPGKMVNISDMGSLARNVLICKLMQRVNRVFPIKSSSPSSFSTSTPSGSGQQCRRSRLRYLDLSDVSRTQILKILDSVLLAEESRPLEVIELGPSQLDWCDVGVKQLFRSAGWKPRCVGKRSWVERL